MRTLLLAALLAAVATTASAETTTPYQPISQSWSHSGYAETQVDYNRLRVSFRGKSGASRESVETNLLYRAAELTLQRGFDYFVVVDHNVDAAVEFESVGPPLPPIAPRHYQQETRYTATSDVMMFNGLRPLNAPAAFDARAVQANLAHQIQRPD